jgi:hypothetical protein
MRRTLVFFLVLDLLSGGTPGDSLARLLPGSTLPVFPEGATGARQDSGAALDYVTGKFLHPNGAHEEPGLDLD